ncbi:MAG: pilus assembly protein TadG [Hoeflea sp.]|nr:pilus assembly protein TadG [Hoeflea sp.]|tara:strand:- start:1050 stop:2165 length:1116 start_codon:yes stop_codon:yes gene_type:complete
MTNGQIFRRVRSFCSNKEGNFGMIAAVLAPVIIAGAVLAVDFTNLVSMKSRMQDAADGAALATSTQLADGDLKDILAAERHAEDFFKGLIADDVARNGGLAVTPKATVTLLSVSGKEFWQVDVRAEAKQKLSPMAAVIGGNTVDISVNSVSRSAPESRNAFTMTLVLDKSGSMDWYGEKSNSPKNGRPKKIEALKTAVSGLLGQIDKADPGKKYARVGAVSYDSSKGKTTHPNWGTSNVNSFVKGLSAYGGTSSTDAFSWALIKLTDHLEDKLHLKMNGLIPSKYIVLMTDGDNTYSKDDIKTQAYCETAKAAGVTVYSVAFMAPERGKKLLHACASDDNHYFDANDADALIAAFENIGKNAAKEFSRLVK